MKRLFFLIIILSLFACSEKDKTDDPLPAPPQELSDTLLGKWKYSRYADNAEFNNAFTPSTDKSNSFIEFKADQKCYNVIIETDKEDLIIETSFRIVYRTLILEKKFYSWPDPIFDNHTLYYVFDQIQIYSITPSTLVLWRTWETTKEFIELTKIQ